MGNKGIPGFLIDVNMDDRVKLIQAEFGYCRALGLLVALWQKIYSTDYYLEWTEEVSLLFSSELRENANYVSEVIQRCVQRGLFDKELFEKYGILTSKRIQETFFKYTERRKKVEIVEEYLLTFDVLKNPNVIHFSRNGKQKQKNDTQKKQIKSNQIKSKDKTIDKGNHHFLTYLLLEKGFVDKYVDLERFDDLFTWALENNTRNDCIKVTNYIIDKTKNKAIDNPFAYFKKSFEDGLKNLDSARERANLDYVKNLIISAAEKFTLKSGGQEDNKLQQLKSIKNLEREWSNE